MAKIVTSAKKSGRRPSRLKMPLACLAGTILLLGGIFWLAGGLDVESLTGEQILSKQDWREEEIVATAAQRLHAKSRRSEPEVFRHLQMQIDKLPPERRAAVREKIMKSAVEQGLRDYRLLPEDKRQEVVKRLAEQAQRRKQEIAKGQEVRMPGEAAAGITGADAQEARQQAGRAVSHIMDSLSADERRDLAPLIKEWVQIAERL